MSELNHYQPDQPYGQLDDLTKALSEVIAADPISRWATDGTEAAEPEALTPREYAWSKMLLETLAAPDFPPGLPPRLQELLREEDRGDTLPPDAP